MNPPIVKTLRFQESTEISCTAKREWGIYKHLIFYLKLELIHLIFNILFLIGGELWELLEPVDSLHPTQDAQRLITKALWNHLERKIPHVLGPVNKNNNRIRQLFGDQGGH